MTARPSTVRVALVGGPMYDPLYDAIPAFERAAQLRVDVVAQLPHPELNAFVKDAFESGAPLDVISTHTKYAPSQAQWLSPLDEVMPGDLIDDLLPRPARAVAHRRRLLQIPRNLDVRLLHYRRDLIATRARRRGPSSIDTADEVTRPGRLRLLWVPVSRTRLGTVRHVLRAAGRGRRRLCSTTSCGPRSIRRPAAGPSSRSSSCITCGVSRRATCELALRRDLGVVPRRRRGDGVGLAGQLSPLSRSGDVPRRRSRRAGAAAGRTGRHAGGLRRLPLVCDSARGTTTRGRGGARAAPDLVRRAARRSPARRHSRAGPAPCRPCDPTWSPIRRPRSGGSLLAETETTMIIPPRFAAYPLCEDALWRNVQRAMIGERLAGRRGPPGRGGGPRHRRRRTCGQRRSRSQVVSFDRQDRDRHRRGQGHRPGRRAAHGACRRPRRADRSRSRRARRRRRGGQSRSAPRSRSRSTADVSCSADVSRAVESAVERFGGIDVLVNNAGIHFARAVDAVHRRGMEPDLRGERERRVLHDSRGAAGAAPLARCDRERLVDDGAGRPGSRRRLRGVERRAGVDDQGAGAGAGRRRHPRQLRVPGRRGYAAAARRGRPRFPIPRRCCAARPTCTCSNASRPRTRSRPRSRFSPRPPRRSSPARSFRWKAARLWDIEGFEVS